MTAHPHRPEYVRALGTLWRRSAYERGLITDPFGSDDAGRRGLRRMRALLDGLGAPDRGIALLHVAGSKGKGSTTALAAAALTAAGHRCGRYVSPHLHSFRERMAVDGEPVDEEAFAGLAARADEAALALERDAPELGTVSTFELVTAMALLAFAEAGCGVAVLETGLGGEFDATNVVDPLACAITRIDLEHTAVLGSTIGEIARAKAGIIKPGRPCAIGPNPEEALDVFRRAALAAGSEAFEAGADWQAEGSWRSARLAGPWGDWRDVALGLAGDHQVENAGTAAAALWLIDRAGVAVGEAAVRRGFSGVGWPGRFERVEMGGVTFVLDGAHTPAAAAALAAAIQAELPGRRATLVLGASADKDPDALLAALAPVTSRVIAVRADSPRAADPKVLERAAREAAIPAESGGSVAEGVAAGRAFGGLVVVTGSLYVVGEAREALGLAEPDPGWGPWLAEGLAGPVG